MTNRDKAIKAAWKRVKDFLFIQDVGIEERAIPQAAMYSILEKAITAYEEAMRSEGDDKLVEEVKNVIGKAVTFNGIWNIKEGQKLRQVARAAIAVMGQRPYMQDRSEMAYKEGYAQGYLAHQEKSGYEDDVAWKESDALKRLSSPQNTSPEDKGWMDISLAETGEGLLFFGYCYNVKTEKWDLPWQCVSKIISHSCEVDPKKRTYGLDNSSMKPTHWQPLPAAPQPPKSGV